MIGEKEAKLHARLPIFSRRVNEAQSIVEQTLEMCRAPFVACSFGKDSAALLHLVMQARPEIEARFIRWPETHLLDDYDHVIAAWREMGARITILDLTRATLDERTPGRWDALRDVAAMDGQFVGLRADESKARSITLGVHGKLYRTAAGYWRSCPLASWSTADVAAYIVKHDVPTLRTYVKHGFESRTSSRIPRAAHSIREQALQRLREDDPAAYQMLRVMFPEMDGVRSDAPNAEKEE